MFYETGHRPGVLTHDPFKAIVSPRPIGWIGTKSKEGALNLAPYSFFAAIADRPPLVMFSSSGRKDSQRNVEETGVFTTNLAGRALLDAMNLTSAPAPSDTDEFALAGLTPVAGTLVDAPVVAEAYAALECHVVEVKPLVGLDGLASENTMIIGRSSASTSVMKRSGTGGSIWHSRARLGGLAIWIIATPVTCSNCSGRVGRSKRRKRDEEEEGWHALGESNPSFQNENLTS